MTERVSTLCDVLQLRARQQPQQTAYIYLKGGEGDELPIDYSELDRQARAIAAALQGHCVPGDRALLLYPPGLEFIAAFFGCLYAGVIAVPAYPPRANRNLSRLRAIVDDCQAKVVLGTEPVMRATQTLSTDAGALGALPWIASDRLEPGREDDWIDPSPRPTDLAFLQYTSGSTGAPKGVMISHGNLMHNSNCLREHWDHSAASIGVCWLPQFHDLGLIAGILQPIFVGFKSVLFSPTAFIQKPFRWLGAISRYRGTTTCAPNFSFDLCVSKTTPAQRAQLDLSSLQTVMNGAEPVLAETLRNFCHAFASCGFSPSAFRGGYGLAEGTVFVTTGARSPAGPAIKLVNKKALEQHHLLFSDTADRATLEVVSCGRGATDQRIEIVNPDSHTRCTAGQVGEIWVKGPSVAQGYWRRSEETAATFRATLDDTGAGPFLRTGDLGFSMDDELYVTGRIKDLIIVRGRNHYPQDIERTVERTHPALRASCGAAFSIRDEGEQEQAVVVQELRREHGVSDLNQLMGDIFQAVAEEHELALHSVVLIAEGDINKTSSGKIQRKLSRQRYLERDLKVVAQSTFGVSTGQDAFDSAAFLNRLYRLDPEECRAQLEAYLIQTLRSVRPGFFYLDVHRSLVRTGLDSLGVTELKAALERDLAVDLPHATLLEASIKELSEQVTEIVTTREYSGAPSDIAMLKGVDALSDAEVSDLLDEMLSATGTSNG